MFLTLHGVPVLALLGTKGYLCAFTNTEFHDSRLLGPDDGMAGNMRLGHQNTPQELAFPS